jgi:tetratricopeptide (TPR) repeat protein
VAAQRENRETPKAYFKGLNLLLNEQQDKAIDAFIEAVQHDPDTTELHFALGNLFRRRGEFERAVRVHNHLLGRADLASSERDRAQHALAQDFMKAGLFDRAEQAYRALQGTAFDTEARLALLNLYERSRDWAAAAETAAALERSGTGSFGTRIAHHWCELALEADAKGHVDAADNALAKARAVARTRGRCCWPASAWPRPGSMPRPWPRGTTCACATWPHLRSSPPTMPTAPGPPARPMSRARACAQPTTMRRGWICCAPSRGSTAASSAPRPSCCPTCASSPRSAPHRPC